MGTNTGKNHRVGSVKDRVQAFNPKTEEWVKMNTETGKIIDVKKDGEPFKGVAKQKDERRN